MHNQVIILYTYFIKEVINYRKLQITQNIILMKTFNSSSQGTCRNSARSGQVNNTLSSPVLIIYCCLKNQLSPKLSVLKITTTYLVQNLQSGQGSVERANLCSMWHQLNWTSDDLFPEWLTYLAGNLMLATSLSSVRVEGLDLQFLSLWFSSYKGNWF